MRKKIFKSICAIILSVNLLSLIGCGQYVYPEESIKSSIYQAVKNVSDKLTNVSESVSNTYSETSAAEDKKPIPAEANQDRFKDCYAYSTLTEEEQIAYSEIYDCVTEFEESAVLTTEDSEVVTAAFEAILADYGGIFWMDGYGYTSWTDSVTNEVLYIEVEPNYTMTEEERSAYQSKIDTEVNNILAGLPADADDYGKIKYFYETLIKTVEYEKASTQNQNIISTFINKKTVCKGYANAMQYLLEKAGIPCTIITGYANGESHAWNLVKLDGDFYYTDTTWGNPNFLDGSKPEGYIDYKYLNVTTEDIEKTHVNAEDFVLPECTASSDNYYVREGLYFDTFDENVVGNIISDAYSANKTFASVRFSDSFSFTSCVEYFIDNQKIFDYCPGLSGISYAEDSDNNIFTVFFA